MLIVPEHIIGTVALAIVGGLVIMAKTGFFNFHSIITTFDYSRS